MTNSLELLARMVAVTLRNLSRRWNPSDSEGDDSASADERQAARRTISPWQLRARFFLLLLPRILIGRGTPTRLAGYAVAAGEGRNQRIAAWCWRRVSSKITRDPQAHEPVVTQCLHARAPQSAAAYALSLYDKCGLLPADAVRLVGELVLQGADESALRIYERLLERCAGEIHGTVPAPVPRRLRDGSAVGALLAKRAGNTPLAEVESAVLDLEIARLCFRFSAFSTAARLFERADVGARFDREDYIAYTFALLKSHDVRAPSDISERVKTVVRAADVSMDWRSLFAAVLFANHSVSDAAAAVESVLKSRFHEHPDLTNMIGHCRRIVECLSNFPNREFGGRGPYSAAEKPRGRTCLRKIFVCGNGWSGSGALYDALMDYDCVAGVPEAPIDRYINACTGEETMFVQGNAGLGQVWRQARDGRRLSPMDLWDLFRCHVIGAGGVGHSEHKGINVAANLLERLGSRYTAVFLDFFEAVNALPEDAGLGELRSILVHATEALTSVVTGVRDGQFAVFNNAIFGPNIDMVEIFSNFRLAVVVRDPLDQYADRRAQDVKHWMSARRFVSHYRSSREAFQQRKRRLHKEHAGCVREVEFERFIRDATYREIVIDWMLDGSKKRRIRRNFDAERSRRNIGIYRQILSGGEIEVIDRELRRWRRS